MATASSVLFNAKSLEQLARFEALCATPAAAKWSPTPEKVPARHGLDNIDRYLESLVPYLGDEGRAFLREKLEAGAFELIIDHNNNNKIYYLPTDIADPQLVFKPRSVLPVALVERSFARANEREVSHKVSQDPLAYLQEYLRPEALAMYREFEEDCTWSSETMPAGGRVFVITPSSSDPPVRFYSPRGVEMGLVGLETPHAANKAKQRAKHASDEGKRRELADLMRFMRARKTYAAEPAAQAKMAGLKTAVLDAAVELYGHLSRPVLAADLDALLAHHDARSKVRRNGALLNAEWGTACGRVFDADANLRHRGDGGAGMLMYALGPQALQQRKEAATAGMLASLVAHGRR